MEITIIFVSLIIYVGLMLIANSIEKGFEELCGELSDWKTDGE
mgnify:CR=1 FL=1